jgi:hypothetical protein
MGKYHLSYSAGGEGAKIFTLCTKFVLDQWMRQYSLFRAGITELKLQFLPDHLISRVICSPGGPRGLPRCSVNPRPKGKASRRYRVSIELRRVLNACEYFEKTLRRRRIFEDRGFKQRQGLADESLGLRIAVQKWLQSAGAR